MLELRGWLRRVGGGGEGAAAHSEALAELSLTPDDSQLRAPRFFLCDRAAELREREEALRLAAQAGAGAAEPDQQEDQAGPLHAEPAAADGAKDRKSSGSWLAAAAAAVISQSFAQAPASPKEEEECNPQPAAQPLSEDQAAIRLQAVMRGMLVRRRLAAEREEEEAFLGMRPPLGAAADARAATLAADALNAQRRRQLRIRYGTEQAAARAPVREALLLREGPALREAIQTKLLSWVTLNRVAESGEYPDLPSEAQGGIASILDAPEPQPEPAKGAKTAAKTAAKPAGKAAAALSPPPDSVPLASLQLALSAFASTWASMDEHDNAQQTHVVSLLEDVLRPSVVAQLRGEVEADVRQIIQDLRLANQAERAARPAMSAKGAKKPAPVAKAAAAPPRSAVTHATTKGRGGGKDLTADVPLETLCAELHAAGILRLDLSHALSLQQLLAPPPLLAAPVPVDAASGVAAKAPPAKKGAPVSAPPPPPHACLADCVDVLVEHLVMPLGIASPMGRGVLLVGAKGAGTTLLALAAAAAAGAAVLDLTPAVNDGCEAFAGKALGALLVHKAFKVARALAPAVILVDDAHTLFSLDKKATPEGAAEPFNRLRRDVMREAAALQPCDRVALLAATSDPAALLGKDAAGIGALFAAVAQLPSPDDGARRQLWRAFGADELQAATLSALSEGRSAGQIKACAAALPSTQRVLEALLLLGPPFAEEEEASAKAVADVRAAIEAAGRAAPLASTGKR